MNGANGKVRIMTVKILGLIVLSLLFMQTSFADERESASQGQNYSFKVISTIEYSGKGQYRSQAENIYTVRKQKLADNMVGYRVLSSGDNIPAEYRAQAAGEMGFTIDNTTHRIMSENPQLSLLEVVNNECVKNLKKISSETIGKSWEQQFELSVLGSRFPKQIKLSLNAIGLTANQNQMIAVKAVSDLFTVNVITPQGKNEPVKCRISSVYLFDSTVEGVLLSVSAFDATTKMNGYDEQLHNEAATYKLTENGKPIDLGGISKDFEKMLGKMGLKRDELKVTKKTTLPQWIRNNLMSVIEASNITAATACEGALNPVLPICAATAQTFGLQSAGVLVSSGAAISVSKALIQAVPGISGMKIAMAPAAIMGLSPTTAGAIAGATAGGVAIAGGGGGGSDDVRSPVE